MPLKYPDIMQHNNADYAIADAEFIRGGGRVVADLAALYALSSKADQLKVRVTRVWVTAEAKYYVLKDMTNVGNSGGWEVESTGGGDFEPKITKSTGLLSWTGTAWAWVVNIFVPNTRKITINGSQQDLTADRTWTIATGDPNSHTHANKAALDKIAESAGNPTWNGGAWPGGAGIDDEVTAPDSTWSSEKISEELTGKAPSAHSHSYNSLSDKPDIPDAYTHPYTHPTTILDGVDAANGAEDYYLNQKGEFKKVEAGSTETGLTIRAKLEALAGEDKLNYSALQGVVSSYTLDFRDDVTQVQDINIEGNIRIDTIQTVNVATLQLGAVTLTLPLSAPINIAQGSYNVWTITRNNASAASVGIKYTKL